MSDYILAMSNKRQIRVTNAFAHWLHYHHSPHSPMKWLL